MTEDREGKGRKDRESGEPKQDIRRNIAYFAKPGKVNTEEVLGLARERARDLGIGTVIVPSTSGETGVKAYEIFKDSGVQIIVVTLHFGFREKGEWTMEEEKVKYLNENGVCIFTCTHGLSGIERSFREEFGGISLAEGIAQAMKGLFGQGLKVALEITLMAADGGLAPVNEDVIALGGTAKGVDTALVLRPSHSNSFLDMRVREIIAMPR